MELYKVKVLSTPSPKEIFLTVKDEFIKESTENIENQPKAEVPNITTAKKETKKDEEKKDSSPKTDLEKKEKLKVEKK